MELSKSDVEKLRTIFSVCAIGGIESIVITQGLVRGTNETRDAAIISETDLTIGAEYKIGLSPVQEFDKRLQLFSDANIECKLNGMDVTLLTIGGGKSKAQFRCMSERLMRYPKELADTPVATITLTRSEAQQISRAAKAFKSEFVTFHISRQGTVAVECSDVTNDKFSMELDTPAEYVEDADSYVFSYVTKRATDVMDAATKDNETVTFVIGETGSAQATVKGHTLIILPQTEE